MDDDSPLNLTTKDVYDLATNIVSEFESVVDICGMEMVNPLVLKIVNVLEHLETTVSKLEFAEKDIVDLKFQNDQLKSKKVANDEDKIKLQQDLEQIEEHWNSETQQLKTVIAKLQEDHKRLQNLLEEKSCFEHTQASENCTDQYLIQDMKNAVRTLNNTLKEKECQLQKSDNQIGYLKSKIEQLGKLNRAFHHRFDETQSKLNHLYQDKTKLKLLIQNQEKTVKSLEQNLREVTREKLDLEENCNSLAIIPCSEELRGENEIASLHMTSDPVKELLREQENFQNKIIELEQQLMASQNQVEMFKQKYLESSKLRHHNTQHYFRGSYGIRQLFHLFLGVVTLEPQNFRNY